jgi:hypothetical protein
MLDCLLALNCIADIVVVFTVNKPLQPVSLCEAGNEPLAMLESTARQIACDADIQDAVTLIRHEIEPATAHQPI